MTLTGRQIKSYRGRPANRTPSFGLRLRAARRHLGLSQAALAKLVGVTARSIIRYETGTSFPPMDLIAELAAGVHLELTELLGEGEEGAGTSATRLSVRRSSPSSDVPGLIRNRPALRDWYWAEMARLSKAGWPDELLEGIKRVLERTEDDLARLFGTTPESVSDEEILRNWRDVQLPLIDHRRRTLASVKPSAA